MPKDNTAVCNSFLIQKNKYLKTPFDENIKWTENFLKICVLNVKTEN